MNQRFGWSGSSISRVKIGWVLGPIATMILAVPGNLLFGLPAGSRSEYALQYEVGSQFSTMFTKPSAGGNAARIFPAMYWSIASAPLCTATVIPCAPEPPRQDSTTQPSASRFAAFSESRIDRPMFTESLNLSELGASIKSTTSTSTWTPVNPINFLAMPADSSGVNVLYPKASTILFSSCTRSNLSCSVCCCSSATRLLFASWILLSKSPSCASMCNSPTIPATTKITLAISKISLTRLGLEGNGMRPWVLDSLHSCKSTMWSQIMKIISHTTPNATSQVQAFNSQTKHLRCASNPSSNAFSSESVIGKMHDDQVRITGIQLRVIIAIGAAALLFVLVMSLLDRL